MGGDEGERHGHWDVALRRQSGAGPPGPGHAGWQRGGVEHGAYWLATRDATRAAAARGWRGGRREVLEVTRILITAKGNKNLYVG